MGIGPSILITVILSPIYFILYYPLIVPITLLFKFRESLHFSVWLFILFVSAGISFFSKRKFGNNLFFGVLVFYFSFGFLCCAIIDGIKFYKVRQFDRDDYKFTSTLVSVIRVTEEPKFFVHAAVLKDCRAYGWSHKSMGFYEMESEVAKIVLPQWLEKCPAWRVMPRNQAPAG